MITRSPNSDELKYKTDGHMSNIFLTEGVPNKNKILTNNIIRNTKESSTNIIGY